MVTKILVANRGEIAVRIMRTASEMGIRTVGVYSKDDAGALHVAVADEAVCLGESEPSQSYLNMDAVVLAARQTGADAIHPGYGFLSENPAFAARVLESGLTFIGPPVAAMRQLGNKIVARQLATKAGVPIIPGTTKTGASLDDLRDSAKVLGYPVLLKASAGGGGKGMRLVKTPDDLPEAALRAASEAQSAFGDASIYLEKALLRPRHVEVQVLGDSHGNLVHLFERECSIQRRHQKIVEESPSPALTTELREKMGAAAIAIARAAGYENAGTVEFLLDASGRFYFLEVNTRLQVEHPITEMVVGLDLVRHQIEIARGKPLPFTQQDLRQHGHAIECRIYAEDPSLDFMPSAGSILVAAIPCGPGIRYDCGIFAGMNVPIHYDPILGKLIAWGENRDAAIARMIHALRECVVLGVPTPIELLIDVIGCEAFRAGDTHTDFLQEHFADWQPDPGADELAKLAAAAARSVAAPVQKANDESAPSPWLRIGRWDMV
jgi:acetyl-CoA carboxylase biotin carboxylase subunit